MLFSAPTTRRLAPMSPSRIVPLPVRPSLLQAVAVARGHAPPPNIVFALCQFTGHGAELMRQEVTEPESELRRVLQSTVEHDIATALSHLAVSVHAVRCVAGAPARRLVVRYKMDPGSDNMSGAGGNAFGLGGAANALYCAIAIRCATPQQSSAVTISLRATVLNPFNFKAVAKLMERVCVAKPTRVVGDLKWRTPFEATSLATALLRMEEVPSNAVLHPKWFSDVFAAPSHMYHAPGLHKYIDESALELQEAAHFRTAAARAAGGGAAGDDGRQHLHVNYHSPLRGGGQTTKLVSSSVVADGAGRRAGGAGVGGGRYGGGGASGSFTTTVNVSEADAMFVPAHSAHAARMAAASRGPVVEDDEPIVLSRFVKL